MKAASYSETGVAKDVLKVKNHAMPQVGEGEVLISLKASGINPSDVKRRAGWQKKVLPSPLIIPHSDGAGQVVEVGSGVDIALIGTRVWVWNAQGAYDGPGRAFGTAAEFISISVNQIAPLPQQLNYNEGACLGVPFRTAHRAVFADGKIDGKIVLVQGAGGVVGNFAVQLARKFGATVIGTASSEARANHAREAGAQYIVDRHSNSFIDEILEITKGSGVDRVVEIEFGGNLAMDIAVLKPNGIIAAYSSTAIPTPAFPYYDLAAKGGQINLVQSFNLPTSARLQAQADLENLCSESNFQVAIGKTLSLDEIVTAHELVEEKALIGNVVLEI
jgi:NADPH2:quinone reductase